MKYFSTYLPAVILDWAGTTVDYGCLAPTAALRSIFERYGVPLSASEARADMGRPKKDHLRSILLGSPAVASRWTDRHGKAPDELLIDTLYPELETAILETVGKHADVIPGVVPFIEGLRSRGVKIGTTTGYSSDMMWIVASVAARQGYAPDLVVTPDDVPGGRPTPYMILSNALRLKVWPVANFVKIGDTPSDIAEGRNAGCWTIGVALTGNALGLSQDEIESLALAEREALFTAARDQLKQAGADYVVDSISAASPVVEEIAERIQLGERAGSDRH